MLGPWYVGDSPVSDLVITVERDGETLDLDDYASASVILYKPDGTTVAWGSTPTIDTVDDTVTLLPPPASPFTVAGEYQLFIRLTATSGMTETFLADTIQVLALGNRVTVAEVEAYLGDTSYTTAEIQDALDTEAAAQRDMCRIGPVYSNSLRQALKRRVARNLAMRQLPLSVLQGDAELGGGVLPGRDPEVRRLEAPYRRLVVG